MEIIIFMVYVLSFLTALIISFIITPLLGNLALRRHFLDHPDDRKIHNKPVPLLGGIAIFVSLILTIFSTMIIADMDLNQTLVGLIFSATILVILGLVDDRRGMSPKIKLSGQLLAAGIIIFCNCRVALIPNDTVAVLFSFFWIVGLTNALNLLDNMDGMTGGVAVIASGAIFIVSILTGQTLAAILSLALAGAALGYLRYNFPPATIFLGDAGSMLIGFILASLGLMITHGQSTSVGLSIPLLILAYPIFDTTLVTITRLKEGRKISQGGKDHSTHRIRTLVKSDRMTTLIVYTVNMILAGSALFLYFNLSLTTTLALLIFTGFGLVSLGIKLSVVPVDIRRVKPVELSITPSVHPDFVSSGTNGNAQKLSADRKVPAVSPQ